MWKYYENIEVWFIKTYLISIFLFSLSFSQVDSTKNIADLRKETCSLYKLSLGIGLGTMNVGGIVSFTYDFTSQFISIHIATTAEFQPVFGDQPPEHIGDVGILYGISNRWTSWYTTSAGAGVSYVYSINRGQFLYREKGFLGSNVYEKIFRSTVGIPFQTEISIVPFPYLGFAIIGFANINSIRVYAGITICLQIGKLR